MINLAMDFYITPTLRQFVVKRECWWLIDLITIAVRLTPALRDERSFWRLDMTLDPATSEPMHWLVTATDGGKHGNPEVKLYEQRIEYSDIDPEVLPLMIYCFPQEELQGDSYLLMLPEDY